ncbi:MAG: hypothetical protein A2X46_06955 [Lentisphaerae bacterium GWF2_57_35]|nr:MAG: hypothetical protein A2X46_06955 [Lentisphaerae bacterium GWF2_57_35]
MDIVKLNRIVAERLRGDGASQLVIDTFLRHVEKLVMGDNGLISESTIAPPAQIPDAQAAEPFRDAGRQALKHAVMIKLNGGLGTSMGLNKAKSLIPVKNGRTFLDIIVGQVKHLREQTGTSLPLLLMNSFSTHNDTLEALDHHASLVAGQRGIPLFFMQNRVPKLLRETLEPATWSADPTQEWCPPGHGDIYTALVTSHLLDQLLAQGFEYAFVSNADNLGATLDLDLLGFFAAHRMPFMMEVTDRTEADKKGGHLAVHHQGHLLLRESAQCPEQEMEAFQDIAKYRYFNTNNLWLNLRALRDKLAECGNILDLSLIINRKTVDPRDPSSPSVHQLETAMGSAISLFPDAGAIRVPRSRFAPVKTTNDLLTLWSDAYRLTPESHMVLHPERHNVPPLVSLDPLHYRSLDKLLERFPQGAPSLLKCESLSIKGDIRFGKDVAIKGQVALVNSSQAPAVVQDAAALHGRGASIEVGLPDSAV